MIKLFIVLFFISSLFISCATIRKTQFPPAAEITVKEFSSVKEAQNFIKNKWHYLSLLFEQSNDPYYGTPKWTEDCLKSNNFTPVREESGNFFFDSELFLNDRKEPGFCTGNLRDVIYLQCKDEPRVYEINCAVGSCRKILSGNPCPIKK